jgi:microsomal dipeptidase-like Zn-dependent dipeptidase
MHTHLMNHLGFGGKLLHGAPDVKTKMPAGAIYNPVNADLFKGPTCNTAQQPASSVQEALGTCYSTHGGHDAIKNKCGDYLRKEVINGFQHTDAHGEGFPLFARWPRWNDVNHQQMWVDWIKRAYDGGMRVMVALAGNSVTLAMGLRGNQPYDDKTMGDLQIAEIKAFAERHAAFIEIAYDAAGLRRIVGQKDKLAIVVGVELDDIGNFAWNAKVTGRLPTPDQVRQEIRRLHQAGVRYIFPVHLIDNLFAGTAIYNDEFWRANKYQTGRFFDIACSGPHDDITQKTRAGFDVIKNIMLGDLGVQPIPTCPANRGHMNARGLTTLGDVAIHQMMSLRMMIDVDHGGQKTLQDIMAHTRVQGAGDYPLVSGHNGIRAGAERHERSFTEAQFRSLLARRSIVGVGSSRAEAGEWMARARVLTAIGMPIAFGTDINGAEPLPRPPDINTNLQHVDRPDYSKCVGPEAPAPPPLYRVRQCVQYSASFPMAQMGARFWNYNIEGVAHIGLFPDFLKDVENRGGADVVDKMFNGAEAFAQSWERAEQIGASVK